MVSISKIVGTNSSRFSKCLGESKVLVVNLCKMLHIQKKVLRNSNLPKQKSEVVNYVYWGITSVLCCSWVPNTWGKAGIWRQIMIQWSYEFRIIGSGFKSWLWHLPSKLESLTTPSEHLPPPTACVVPVLYPLGHHTKVRPLPRLNFTHGYPSSFPLGRTMLHATWWAKFPNKFGESINIFCLKTQMSFIILSKGIQNSKHNDSTITSGKFLTSDQR